MSEFCLLCVWLENNLSEVLIFAGQYRLPDLEQIMKMILQKPELCRFIEMLGWIEIVALPQCRAIFWLSTRMLSPVV